MQLQTLWMPFVWATAKVALSLLAHSALHAEALYLKLQLSSWNYVSSLQNLFQTVIVFALFPKFSGGHMSCHTALKLCEQSTINLLFSSRPFYPTLWNYFCLESRRSYFKFKTLKQVSSVRLLFLVLNVFVSHLIPFFNLIYVVSVALDLWFTENCNVNLSFLNIASCPLSSTNTTKKICTFSPVVSSVYLQYFCL